jgi:serine/threonine protein kinase
MRDKLGKLNPLPAFPPKIGTFEFYKSLQGLSTYEKYFFALYKNQQGDVGFLKLWQESLSKASGKHNLIREIENIKALDTVNCLDYPSLNICIPKVYGSKVSPSQVWLLSEYIAHQKHQELSLENYKQIREFLKKLGQSKLIKSIIPTKSTAKYFFGFTSICLLSIMIHPKIFTQVVKVFQDFWHSLPIVFDKTKFQLSHLDLKYENIIFQDSKIFLIDFQSAQYAHSLVDFVYSLNWLLVHKVPPQKLADDIISYMRSLETCEIQFARALFSYGILSEYTKSTKE